MNGKKYFNQKHVVSEIRSKTGCSAKEISKILNALGDVAKETLGNPDDHIEIKLFPGLKLTAKYLDPEQSRSNLSISHCGFVLRLDAAFSDYFKKDIRTLHQTHMTNNRGTN